MDANPRIVGDSAARLGESDPATGIGLGLAVSRGMTEATRGTLEPEQTPGVSSASGMGPVEGFSAMSMGPPGRQ